MTDIRKETDSLGEVDVAADKLWGAQTQRSLEHFSIGKDLIPREMITAYATLKKAAANANYAGKRLDDRRHKLIVQVCDEIFAGQHHEMFPLHVWMTGSGTQFNMNVNEVISNRCCQIAGTPLGSKAPVHPNDHVNMAQSSNDSFPSAMCIASAVNVKQRLIPAVKALHDAIAAKVEQWKDIVKIGRTHMQDATPLTLGQEWSGYEGMLADDLERIEDALKGIYRLALGGTAVGTGINSAPGFAEAAAAEIAKLTGLPFVTAPNKFTVQGAHDAQVQLSGTLRTLAVSLYKIANDIRLMSCGPRAGFAELKIPENEPGSSIMPGKVNPTQAEALTMIAVQVMANDVAVGFGGAGGYLEMNVYKPLIIFNVTHSITIMTDGCTNFRKFLVEGTKPNVKKINEYVERSLMLVTALSPVIGYDKASKIALVTTQMYYRKQPQGSRADRQYDEQIVVACGEKPAYGYRRVAWWLRRKENLAVNRKRVLRVMRERGLLVRSRRLRARRKKEWGRVEAAEPNQIWQSDMTKIWAGPTVGWAYLVSVIDCCTREIVSWNLSHRCRTEEALDAVEQAVLARLPQGSRDARVTLTTDNGTQFTSTRFIETLHRLGIIHRRTAYNHPEGNSYIERFHRSLKEEEVWTAEYRNLPEARASIARWIQEYNHDRPHRGVGNRTPHEVFLSFAAVLKNEALTV